MKATVSTTGIAGHKEIVLDIMMEKLKESGIPLMDPLNQLQEQLSRSWPRIMAGSRTQLIAMIVLIGEIVLLPRLIKDIS